MASGSSGLETNDLAASAESKSCQPVTSLGSSTDWNTASPLTPIERRWASNSSYTLRQASYSSTLWRMNRRTIATSPFAADSPQDATRPDKSAHAVRPLERARLKPAWGGSKHEGSIRRGRDVASTDYGHRSWL